MSCCSAYRSAASHQWLLLVLCPPPLSFLLCKRGLVTCSCGLALCVERYFGESPSMAFTTFFTTLKTFVQVLFQLVCRGFFVKRRCCNDSRVLVWVPPAVLSQSRCGQPACCAGSGEASGSRGEKACAAPASQVHVCRQTCDSAPWVAGSDIDVDAPGTRSGCRVQPYAIHQSGHWCLARH